MTPQDDLRNTLTGPAWTHDWTWSAVEIAATATAGEDSRSMGRRTNATVGCSKPRKKKPRGRHISSKWQYDVQCGCPLYIIPFRCLALPAAIASGALALCMEPFAACRSHRIGSSSTDPSLLAGLTVSLARMHKTARCSRQTLMCYSTDTHRIPQRATSSSSGQLWATTHATPAGETNAG